MSLLVSLAVIPVLLSTAREPHIDMPESVFELLELYPQPVEGVPTVEYLRRQRGPSKLRG